MPCRLKEAKSRGIIWGRRGIFDLNVVPSFKTERQFGLSLEVRRAGRNDVLQHQLHAVLYWDHFVWSFGGCLCFTVSLGVLNSTSAVGCGVSNASLPRGVLLPRNTVFMCPLNAVTYYYSSSGTFPLCSSHSTCRFVNFLFIHVPTDLPFGVQ